MVGRARSDRNVSGVVAQGMVRQYREPRTRNGKTPGSVIVTHREYLRDIEVSTLPFTCTQLKINPGDPNTFPWLSRLAVNYEQYEFTRLSFQLLTEAPTTANGFMMLSPDFDALDDMPISKQGAAAYHSAVRAPVWARELTMRCAPADLHAQGKRFVRETEDPTHEGDARLSDVGNINICTGGAHSTLTHHHVELYVEYEVCLYTPQMRVVSAFEHYDHVLDTLDNFCRVKDASETIKRLYEDIPASTGAMPFSMRFNTTGKYTLTGNCAGQREDATSPQSEPTPWTTDDVILDSIDFGPAAFKTDTLTSGWWSYSITVLNVVAIADTVRRKFGVTWDGWAFPPIALEYGHLLLNVAKSRRGQHPFASAKRQIRTSVGDGQGVKDKRPIRVHRPDVGPGVYMWRRCDYYDTHPPDGPFLAVEEEKEAPPMEANPPQTPPILIGGKWVIQD